MGNFAAAGFAVLALLFFHSAVFQPVQNAARSSVVVPACNFQAVIAAAPLDRIYSHSVLAAGCVPVPSCAAAGFPAEDMNNLCSGHSASFPVSC